MAHCPGCNASSGELHDEGCMAGPGTVFLGVGRDRHLRFGPLRLGRYEMPSHRFVMAYAESGSPLSVDAAKGIIGLDEWYLKSEEQADELVMDLKRQGLWDDTA